MGGKYRSWLEQCCKVLQLQKPEGDDSSDDDGDGEGGQQKKK